MRRMLATPPAELLQLQPVRSRLAVLRRRIIPLFAITALQRNDLSGHKTQLLAIRFQLRVKPKTKSPKSTSLAIPNRFSGEEPAFLLASCGADTLVRAIPARPNALASRHPNSGCGPSVRLDGRGRPSPHGLPYCTISEMVPAPTVCPPSRIANRKPFSIATGVISSITSCTLSPGITISVPPGNSATPVTSVVRR